MRHLFGAQRTTETTERPGSETDGVEVMLSKLTVVVTVVDVVVARVTDVSKTHTSTAKQNINMQLQRCLRRHPQMSGSIVNNYTGNFRCF